MNWIPESLREMFSPGLISLANLQFTYSNPLFWLLMLVVFLLLLKLWDIKKSFSFTVVIAIILLITTLAETYFAGVMQEPGEVFDPWLIRFISGVSIAIIFITYLFIVDQNS